jgi:hypothetical protein
MKTTLSIKVLTLILLFGIHFESTAQVKEILQKANQALSNVGSNQNEKDEVVSALKEALSRGAQKGADALSKEDGFFKNELLKIVLPPEAVKVEKTLRSIGLGSQVDEAILSMNRGAEEACKEAAALFIESVKSMNVMDAVSILNGSDSAATQYLRQTTVTSLNSKFRPVIENSLKKVDATKHWASLINAYNKVSLKKINPDLTGYVTEKAINGIFYQIAEEEKKIRRDPLARNTELLKKVFGNVSKQMLMP